MAIEFEKQSLHHSAVDLVLVIGNAHIVSALFCDEVLLERVSFDIKSNWLERLEFFLRGHAGIDYAMLGSINTRFERKVTEILHRYEIPFFFAREHQFSLPLDVNEEGEVGNDRIADVYGVIRLHPGNSIIVNVSTMVAFNVVSKKHGFVAGVIYPGIEACARGLAQHADLLPYADVIKPLRCGAKTIKGSISSGIYHGLLGAIKKIVGDLQQEYFPSGDVTIVLTGSSIMDIGSDTHHNALAKDLRSDLASLVDATEPDLALLGLHEMLRELQLNQTQS